MQASRLQTQSVEQLQSEPLFSHNYDAEEKHDAFQQQEDTRALKDTVRRLRRWLVGISVLLSLSCVGLLLSVHSPVAKVLDPQARVSFIPDIPTTTVTFEKHELFAAPSSQEADQEWAKLMPPGDGFIVVEEPRKYGLPPGKQTPQGEVFDTSIFHELHCLVHIRTFLLTLKAAVGTNNTEELYNRLLLRQEDHVWHCFDYIRQALMCAADLTIEWPRVEEDGSKVAVDGWGITHQCKDWGSVMAFIGEHEVGWS